MCVVCLSSTHRQELEDNFERAAAVAVFHGHIRRGITSLKDGAAVAKQRNDSARGIYLGVSSNSHNFCSGSQISMI